MQLGDLIRRLQEEGVAVESLLLLGDATLLARVASTAAMFDEDVGAYVAAVAGRFAASADDETWLRLIGDVERAADPGAAALRRMVLWALDDDARHAAPANAETAACTCGGGSCHDGR